MTDTQVLAQYDPEKGQFNLLDSDGDGMPDWYEIRFGLNPNDGTDAALDKDSDGLSNLAEFQKGTLPNNPDTDGDGVKDGAETGTGVFVSANDTGTDPFVKDTDGDGLLDGVETGTGIFVSSTDTGTDPNKKDTDGDSWDDYGEVSFGSDPNDPSKIPSAPSWAAAVQISAPLYWYRFEETDPSQAAQNSGSDTAVQGAYGPGIVATNLGRASALPSLGTAIEFTGPTNGSSTTKYVDMNATSGNGVTDIPELVNFRPPSVDKATTVEYWFKTSQKGTHGNNSWQSPAIMAHESPGDGDMYWGKINDQGEFGFSTSDLNDILTRRDMGRNVTDGQWHHLVMVKEWHVNQPCVSTMYLDGGPMEGGASFTTTTAAGNASYQDTDSAIKYLGFVQSGELENVQYIGYLDEVAIYNRALSESEVRLHSEAVFNADTDSDGIPDVYELNNGLDPNNPDDAAMDPDHDGLTNLQEYQKGTDVHNDDTDNDGLLDGVETGTGTWVSANDTGTDPLNADSDGDGLKDGAEDNTGTYVDADHTGTNPTTNDTDNDGFTDGDELALGYDPLSKSSPTVPTSYLAAVQADNPVHFLQFEETTTGGGLTDEGSAGGSFTVTFGGGILDSNLGLDSAYTNLGKAMEFTGPAADNTTTKYVDFGAPLDELVNYRQDEANAPVPIEEGKEATVEYWFKTTIAGSNGNNTWQNPSILAHESGGDGDMYWGNFNSDGDFIFSTSDLHDVHVTNNYATDGTWHHVVMSKIWHTNSPCISRLFIDGGALAGGQTFQTTTGAGATSGQDRDSAIQYIGFTQNGEMSNVQYIGMLDEFATYTNAFVEAQARLHYMAAGGAASVPTVELGFEKSGSDLILKWSQGSLQSADTVTGHYTTMEGVTSPYTNSLSGNQKFFRVLVQ